MVVYLRRATGFWRGAGGVGTVHHMAFRAASDADQLEQRAEIEARGLEITPVIDRQYFHSVYFREPGGVLFEIATDGPGFTIDEPLPSWAPTSSSLRCTRPAGRRSSGRCRRSGCPMPPRGREDERPRSSVSFIGSGPGAAGRRASAAAAWHRRQRG